MNIRDFLDLRQLQEMQDKFSDATGLAAIIVDAKGENVTKGSNFTDFCMKYTRGSEEGNRRCNKCSSENSGVYYCHAGLMEFCIDIMLGNEKLVKLSEDRYFPVNLMKMHSVKQPLI